HWLIAFALAFQLALGFSMPGDERGFALFQLHKSVGISILLLTLARLAWRLTHRPPPAVEGGFQGFLAKAVHTLLYAFMIVAPLTGWIVVSTSRIEVPTYLFGVVPWPHLPVSGALRHQWLLKDGLLRRMAPGGKAWAAYALLLAVVATYFATGMKIASDVVASGGYDRATAAPEPARVPLAAAVGPTASPTPEATEEAEEEEEEAEPEPGPPPTWTIQPGGTLGFTVSSGSDSYRGSFAQWGGTIAFDPENPETADIRITVELASG